MDTCDLPAYLRVVSLARGQSRTGTGVIVWLPQCQWSNLKRCNRIYFYTSKHNNAVDVLYTRYWRYWGHLHKLYRVASRNGNVPYGILTHCGRLMHICVGSDNGLLPSRCQAIIWTNAGILLIGPLGTNLNETVIEIYIFSFKKMHLKLSPGNWRPFHLGLNVLTHWWLIKMADILQMALWNALPWMKRLLFWSNFRLMGILSKGYFARFEFKTLILQQASG